MKPLEIAGAVARYLDRKTGLAIAGEIVRDRNGSLDVVLEDHLIYEAAVQTVKRLAPLQAGGITPLVGPASARRVASVILATIRARTGMIVTDKILWQQSPELQDALSRTFRVFLDELCGRAREEDRLEDGVEARRWALLEILRQADAQVQMLTLRWGTLLSEADNLLIVAEAIVTRPADERNRLLAEVISRVTALEVQPGPETFAQIVRQIAATPAGKA